MSHLVLQLMRQVLSVHPLVLQSPLAAHDGQLLRLSTHIKPEKERVRYPVFALQRFEKFLFGQDLNKIIRVQMVLSDNSKP